MARFHPVKHHATAIRAFPHVTKCLPSAVLLLAGDGDRRAEIERLVDQLGIRKQVQFLSLRQDVPA